MSIQKAPEPDSSFKPHTPPKIRKWTTPHGYITAAPKDLLARVSDSRQPILARIHDNHSHLSFDIMLRDGLAILQTSYQALQTHTIAFYGDKAQPPFTLGSTQVVWFCYVFGFNYALYRQAGHLFAMDAVDSLKTTFGLELTTEEHQALHMLFGLPGTPTQPLPQQLAGFIKGVNTLRVVFPSPYTYTG